MAQNPTVKLPAQRIDQLKLIGRALGHAAIADTVGHLIRSEIARGTIPNAIPGIEVKSIDRESVGIDFGDDPVIFTTEIAAQLADELVKASDGGLINMSVGGDYSITRRGNAVVVAVPADGPRRTLNRDLARDLSNLISAAIDESFAQ